MEGCVSNTVEAADSTMEALHSTVAAAGNTVEGLGNSHAAVGWNTGGVEHHSWVSLYEVDLRNHGRDVVFVLKP